MKIKKAYTANSEMQSFEKILSLKFCFISGNGSPEQAFCRFQLQNRTESLHNMVFEFCLILPVQEMAFLDEYQKN